MKLDWTWGKGIGSMEREYRWGKKGNARGGRERLLSQRREIRSGATKSVNGRKRLSVGLEDRKYKRVESSEVG